MTKWVNNDKPTLEIRKPRAPFATPLKLVPVGEHEEPLQRAKRLSYYDAPGFIGAEDAAKAIQERGFNLTTTDTYPAMGVEPKRANREASQVVIAAVMMTLAAALGYVICYLQHVAAGAVR